MRTVASTSLLLVLPLLLCSLLAPVVTVEAAAVNNARIVGGTVVDISSVPYLVNLRLKGGFICGGALITPTHVLTAAHCVKGVGASKLLVVGGATSLSETGERRAVEKVFTPKAYSTSTLHSDVAVLKLKSPMTGNNVATIELCNATLQPGELIKISGWGKTNERSRNVPQRVRSAEVPLISRKSCSSQYKLRASLSSTMFCASVPGVRDSCEGDSGGPAVYQNQVCGIVSWGIGCARRNSPGVYTSVKAVRSFIDKALSL